MDTQELRGDALAKSIRAEVRAGVDELRARGIAPRLVAVAVDATPAILAYADSKKRAAAELGIDFELKNLPAAAAGVAASEGPRAAQADLEAALRALAADPAVHGIILESPLPDGLDMNAALECIPAHKDIDGLTSTNLGLLYMNHEDRALVAATPQACIMLAETALGGPAGSRVPIAVGARVGVVGHGRTVGTPLIGMLLNRHATLTVCHSQTPDLRAALAECDIVFVAAGKPGLLNRDIIREGQILIDAGTSVVGGKVVGDVDRDAALGVAAAFTPVPQGVGPVTTALIFKNLLRAIALQSGTER